MKIRTMLIVALVFFSILPSIVYGAFLSTSMNATGEKQYNEMIDSITDCSISSIDAYVTSLSGQAKQIAENAAVKAFLSTKSTDDMDTALDVLNGYCKSNNAILRVIIVDSTGNAILNTDSAAFKIEMPLDAIQNFNDSTAIAYPHYAVGKPTSEYDMLAKATVGSNMVLVFSSSENLDSIFYSTGFPTNGRVAFIDAASSIIDTTYVGLIDGVSLPEYKSVVEKIKSGTDFKQNLVYEIGKNLRIAHIKYDTITGWYAVAFAESDSAFVFTSSASGALGITVALSAIIFAAAYIIIIFLITKPLKKIENSLVKIHRGDYESRIEILSRNEYGDIARAFNSLIDEIIVSERRFRTIVEMSDNIVFEWNFKTNNVSFSNNFNQKFSYRAPTDSYSDSFLVKGKMHPEDIARYKKDLEQLKNGDVDFDGNEYRWKNIYGDYMWSQMKTSTIRDKEGNVIKIVGVIGDIDRAKKNEDLLLIKASYDALTGIYNRETIENIIDSEIAKKTAETEDFAILFVDVDNFKTYNDKYSHATGDQVLKFTASSILKIVRDFGFIGRYGGDEFVILIRNIQTNSPADISKKILEVLKEGFVGDNDVHLCVNVSIGISVIKDNSKRVEEIISMADDAMYRIKKGGKSNFGYF